MVSYQEIEKNRDNFLIKNPKYGELALKKAKGISNYKEFAKGVNCPSSSASTMLNQLKNYGLYELGKNGKLKKTKELITIGLSRKKTEIINPEKKIFIRKVRKVNTKFIKKAIEDYFIENFQKIKHPFNNKEIKCLSKKELKFASESFFLTLGLNLKSEMLEGLEIRFYESFVNYFAMNRMKKGEMIVAFSSLIKNFEPYMKKLAIYKTKNIENAKLSLGKKLVRLIMEFEENLDNVREEYWEDKSIKKACIRFTYPYRHIEAHEARIWDVFHVEKVIFYMFASIILINLEL